jgi:hypothetical protein
MYKYHALLSPPTLKPLKMDLIEGSETSDNINQTLGIHPKIETVNTSRMMAADRPYGPNYDIYSVSPECVKYTLMLS